jgi:Flp pilus assembly protein TadB
VQDPNHQEREEQLRQREMELRLRELESEIHRVDAPFHPTVKDTSSNKPVRTFKRDLIIAAKLSGLFLAGVVVVVVVYISQWLAWISFFALLGAAGWAWFEFGRKP